MDASGKNSSIRTLVARLNLRTRGWIIVDHWEASSCSIGIASARDPARLVYVSTFRQPSGTFYYECELPSGGGDEVYRPAGSGSDVRFERLLEIMVAHLGR